MRSIANVLNGWSEWRTSSFTGGNGACVDVRMNRWRRQVEVRDTKLGEASPVLRFTPLEWAAFLAGVKNDEFQLPTWWFSRFYRFYRFSRSLPVTGWHSQSMEKGFF